MTYDKCEMYDIYIYEINVRALSWRGNSEDCGSMEGADKAALVETACQPGARSRQDSLPARSQRAARTIST